MYCRKGLNDLVRRLRLSKEDAELMASDLRSRGLLLPGVTVTYFRGRHKEIIHFFIKLINCAYMSDIPGFFKWLGLDLNQVQEQFRLFIDSSCRSLKAVLLHNGNLPEIPVFYSTVMDEGYDSLKKILELLNFSKLKIPICADFKVINFLRDLKPGNCSFPCIFCTWNSRSEEDQYGARKALRKKIKIKDPVHSVINKPLVDLDRILIPPLHVGLGTFSQLIKSVFRKKPGDDETLYMLNFARLIEQDQEENERLIGNVYLPNDFDDSDDESDEEDLIISRVRRRSRVDPEEEDRKLNAEIMEQFPDLNLDYLETVKFIKKTVWGKSWSKIAAGTFNGAEIRKLVKKREEFESKMPELFREAWKSYVDLCENFLGLHRSDDYVEKVQKLIANYRAQGCLMSIKLHYLDKHLDKFPSNCGLLSDQQGENFHQQLLWWEKAYSNGNHDVMLADFNWNLNAETNWNLSRKTNKRAYDTNMDR